MCAIHAAVELFTFLNLLQQQQEKFHVFSWNVGGGGLSAVSITIAS